MDEAREPVDAAVGTGVADAWETVNQLVSGFFALFPGAKPAGRILCLTWSQPIIVVVAKQQ